MLSVCYVIIGISVLNQKSHKNVMLFSFFNVMLKLILREERIILCVLLF